MRHVLALLITGVLLTSLLAATAATPRSGDYLFTGATLITMTGAGTIRGDLRVIDDRIDAVGPGLQPGPDTKVIDVAGGYLIPGLAEMHAHVPSPDQGTEYRDDVLLLWVANGITTVRGMLGHPDHLALRAALASHEVLGPRLITSGPSFNGNSVSSPEQARQMVRDQAAAGYDFLKIHPGLSRDEYDAMADEAGRQGIRFAGHVPADVGLRHALLRGQASIDHLDGFMQALTPDPDAADSDGGSLFGVALASTVEFDRLPNLITQLRSAGTWVVPTETLIENFAVADTPEVFDARPELAYLPPDLLARYRQALGRASLGAAAGRRALDVRKHLIGELHAAGVGVLLGSDSPQIFNVPGFSIHRELAAMVAAGLTPVEALATGTTAPARYFGRSEAFGALAPGMAADLVWLAADPTADIGNTRSIQGAMVRGRWLDRAALDAGLAAIAGRYQAMEN